MHNNQITNDLLATLSEKEREYALKVLKEYEQSGTSKLHEDLKYADYTEIPIDIETFLRDPRYLGRGVINEEGKFTVFPYWVDLLKEIYPTNLSDAQYNVLALSGAIGLGKSFVAVLCVLYELYRMLCLKDPYIHFGLQPIDKITFAFLNITMDAAKGVAWDKCQQLLQSSEWFLAHGTLSKSINPQWSPGKGIELIYGSQARHIIGRCVYSCFIDEVSFQPNQDVNKQKEKAKKLVNTAYARMQSRFMKGEHNPTMLILASSKRTDSSFMETFIEDKKKNNSTTTRVVDEPQWVIRTDKDSPNKFKVAIGNKYLSSEVLPLNVTEQELSIYRDRGYRILDVPMGYWETFIDDIEVALTDIAGISTSNSNRYFSGKRLSAVKCTEYKNLFLKEIIEVGNAKDDKTQYYEFIDLSRVDPILKSKPMYIHLDMSVSGDKTGIAGVWIVGKKPPEEGVPASKELFFKLAFSVSVKAPKGYQISFEKNRQLIYWLKEQGFNIKGVSSDSFQSTDLSQQLVSKGYAFTTVSMDRVEKVSETSYVCRPYHYLRSTINEERIQMYDAPFLTEELLGLERDNNSGKIDHSPSSINSKDSADAVCGAVYNASLNAEQFAFDYGEDLEVTYKTNTVEAVESDINKEFETLLIQMQDPIQKQMNTRKDEFMDFGMGKAQVLTDAYIANGILVW